MIETIFIALWIIDVIQQYIEWLIISIGIIVGWFTVKKVRKKKTFYDITKKILGKRK